MDDLEALLAEVDSEFIDVDQWLLPLDDDATEFLSDLCSTENGTSLNDQPASSCQFNHTDCSAVTDQDADAARANSAGAIPLPRFELAQEPSLPRIDMASIANEISSLPKRSTRKQQIDDLRIQVAQLTLELRALKQTVGIDTDAPISAEAMNPSTMAEGSPVVGLWKRMALRQRELRQDAEEDQRALQHAVKTYSRRVNHLHRLIEKLSADNHQMPTFDRFYSILRTSLSDDATVLQALAADMEGLYLGIDDSFHQGKMHEILPPGCRSSARRTGPNTWTVHTQDVYVLPFDFKATDRAVWTIETRIGGQKSSDEFRRSFQSRHELAHTVWSVQNRRVSRRCCEDNRTVVTMRQMMQPIPDVVLQVGMQMTISAGPSSLLGETSVIALQASVQGFATPTAQNLLLSKATEYDCRDTELFAEKQWNASISDLHAEIEKLLI